MPLPTPGATETKDDFMARCMSDEIMNGEFPEQSQRAAVCNRQWEGPTSNRARFEYRLARVCEPYVCDARLDAQAVDVLVVPDGIVKSDSGDFQVDGESWKLIDTAFRIRRRAMVFDWEHQTLQGEHRSPDGRAPAAGWIHALGYEPGRGIIASVVWTEKARAAIRAREYLYPSPVLLIRKADRKAAMLHSVALTNDPAIEGIEAVAAKHDLGQDGQDFNEKEYRMGTETPQLIASKGVLAALGAKDTASETEVLALIAGLRMEVAKKPVVPPGSAAVFTALGLKDTASESEMIVAINTFKQGADGMAVMKAELEGIKKTLQEKEAEEALRPHIAAGKINPNDAEDMKVCKALAISDRKAFDHQMAHRLPNPPPGRTNAPPGGKTGDERQTLIAKAGAEWDENPGRCLVNRMQWVNGALREAGKNVLTKEEETRVLTA